MGFRPTTTEFHSDALTDWAFRSWVQLAIRANFVQLLQFHRLFSVGFHFGYCLRESSRLFSSKFSWVNHMSVAEWIDKQDIHHWRILWSSYIKLAWVGLYPQPLNSIQMLKPTELSGHEFNSHSEPTLYNYSNFIICSVSDFI